MIKPLSIASGSRHKPLKLLYPLDLILIDRGSLTCRNVAASLPLESPDNEGLYN
ncbi:MAG: hypothetical protein ACE10G_05500 [Gemmatimonadales bacterium]